MRRLAHTPELLDGPLDDPVALADNLRDLRRVNRHLGGIALSRRALGALVADRTGSVSLLDVGTGAADIPAALVSRPLRDGPRLTVTAVDNRAEVLLAAVAGRPELASMDGLKLTIGDGRALADRMRATTSSTSMVSTT